MDDEDEPGSRQERGHNVRYGLAEQWAAADRANPKFWHAYCAFTLQAIDRGFKHYGSVAIINRVRWQSDIELKDGSNFKVNNNWSPFYARKFHAEYPQHAGFFRCRWSKADLLIW